LLTVADCAGKQVTPGELLTALEGAPLDTVYLDAAGQEKGAYLHLRTSSSSSSSGSSISTEAVFVQAVSQAMTGAPQAVMQYSPTLHHQHQHFTAPNLRLRTQAAVSFRVPVLMHKY
jgi:hypothetical protein